MGASNAQTRSNRRKVMLSMATSDSTTHSIYRIVCFTTGKCYIGRSNDAKSRKNHHWSVLRRGIHHSLKLQRAFNKYGAGVFFFEVLETDISSDKINEMEVFWIRQFNSYLDGYNMTEGGDEADHLGTKCTWNGIEYVSFAEAGRANNVHASTVSKWVELGYSCDSDVPPTGRTTHAKKCTWNGITYSTTTEAAKANGISVNSMFRRIHNGYTCDEDMPSANPSRPLIRNGIEYTSLKAYRRSRSAKPHNLKPCTWNGITYESIRAAAIANNVDHGLMSWRIRKGYTSDSDIGATITCEWNGIQYPSYDAAGRANNVDGATIARRISKGYTSDNNAPKAPSPKECVWNGIKYKTISDAAKANNVGQYTMTRRIRLGYTCDEDMKRPRITQRGLK